MFRLLTQKNHNIKDFLRRSFFDEKRNKSFLSVYSEITKVIFQSDLYLQAPEHNKHFLELLDYNWTKEHSFKPEILLDTYQILENSVLTASKLHLANVFACCLKMSSIYMNLSDDIIVQKENRCNDICWYKKENIGLNGFNDAIFFYEAAFILLKQYFDNKSTYLPLWHLLRRIRAHFIIAQTIDPMLIRNKNPDFTKFNSATYTTLNRYKGGLITIVAPFQAALILSQSDNFDVSQDVVAEISHLYQTDKEILDVFENGKPKDSVVEHIREGQCTWMAVQVLEHGSRELIQTFTDNYGRATSECEKKVIDVYLKMNLYNQYIGHKKKILEHIHKHVRQIDSAPLQKAVLNLCKEVHLEL